MQDCKKVPGSKTLHAICHQAVKLRSVTLHIESRSHMQGGVAGVAKQFVTKVRDQLQAMRTAELSLQCNQA